MSYLHLHSSVKGKNIGQHYCARMARIAHVIAGAISPAPGHFQAAGIRISDDTAVSSPPVWNLYFFCSHKCIWNDLFGKQKLWTKGF